MLAIIVLPNGELVEFDMPDNVELDPLDLDEHVVEFVDREATCFTHRIAGKPPIEYPAKSALTLQEYYDVESVARHVSANLYQQERYIAMRLMGTSHSLAEVLATCRFPGVSTDSTWNAGRCNGNQFEKCPAMGDYYRSVAERGGVNTVGKQYLGQLARYPGDPRAWVSDRGDVKRICESEGWGVTGAGAAVAMRERDPGPPCKLAPSILASYVRDEMERNPGQRLGDVQDRLYKTLTGAVDPHPLRVQETCPDEALGAE